MPYALGIDLSSDRLTAAVTRMTSSSWTKPEVFRPDEYPFAGCVERVGDDVPIMLAGRMYSPHWMVAELALWLVQQVAEQQGLNPGRLVISHPGGWGAYRRFLLSEALAEVGLPGTTLIAQPIAAAAQSQGVVGIYTPRSTAVVRNGEMLACHDACDLAELTAQSLAQTVKSVKLKPEQLQRILVIGNTAIEGFRCPIDRNIEPAAGAALIASQSLRPPERPTVAPLPRPPVTVTDLSLPKKRILQLGRR